MVDFEVLSGLSTQKGNIQEDCANISFKVSNDSRTNVITYILRMVKSINMRSSGFAHIVIITRNIIRSISYVFVYAQ